MTSFVNKYTGTIDEKGRIVLPSEFKKTVNEMGLESVILEKDDVTKSVLIHPEKTWEIKVKTITGRLNQQNPKHALFLQRFFQNFFRVSVASNGRINIPNDFLAFANLDKKVLFTGMYNHISMTAVDNPAQKPISDEDYNSIWKELGKINEE